MANTTFDAFIERLTLESPDNDNAWTAVRDEWLQNVEAFFGTIQGYLGAYIDQGKISVSYGEKVIYEEHIGEYSAKSATIKIGGHTVKLDPIGTNLIGAKGRVDMIGPLGIIRFLLVDKDAKSPRGSRSISRRIKEDIEIVWAWKIATEPPIIEYYDLDENSFFDALMEVVNA